MKQLSSGLISISESGECLSANSAVSNILGIEETDIINKPINALNIYENQSRNFLTRYLILRITVNNNGNLRCP